MYEHSPSSSGAAAVVPTTAATGDASSPTGKEQASTRDVGTPRIDAQGNIRRTDIETANPVVTIDPEVKDRKNAVAGAPDNKGSDLDDRSDDGLQADERSLLAALRAQHVDVTVVEADKIPKDMAGLQKYDGLVLSNVSSLKMTKKQMENIRDYVREQGGGLIMLGGEESFGLGGYYRTPIEEALPVTMEVKQKIEIPSLAVVLSIDRSGSMAMTTDEKVTKLDIAKEAAHLVVDLLDERNEVGVMSWDTEFIWDSAMKPARDKTAIHHAIATIKAGGGTDGYPALKESYQVLFDRPALLKHVIFLSDGQMTRGDFSGLLRRMARGENALAWIQARWGRIVGEPLSRKIEPTGLSGRRLTVSLLDPAWRKPVEATLDLGQARIGVAISRLSSFLLRAVTIENPSPQMLLPIRFMPSRPGIRKSM